MGFQYNGISSQSMNIKARLTGWQMVPSLRSNTETVPGKAGLADFGADSGERYIDVACNVYPQKTFADMVADTFNAYVVTDGVQTLAENATVNGAAGSISLFFILFAVVFGVSQHRLKLTGWKEVVFGLVCTVLAFVLGMNFPVILGKEMWV